jgi:hypothetical protein
LKIEFCLIERPNEMEKRTFNHEQVAGIVRDDGPSPVRRTQHQRTNLLRKKKHEDMDVSHFGGQVKGDAGWQGTAA